MVYSIYESLEMVIAFSLVADCGIQVHLYSKAYFGVLLVWIHDSIPLVNTLSLWNNLETTASPTDIMHYEQDHAAHWTTFDLASVACVISRSELPKGS